VHKFLVREFFLHNKLMQPDQIEVLGQRLDLGKITTPTYCVAATGAMLICDAENANTLRFKYGIHIDNHAQKQNKARRIRRKLRYIRK